VGTPPSRPRRQVARPRLDWADRAVLAGVGAEYSPAALPRSASWRAPVPLTCSTPRGRHQRSLGCSTLTRAVSARVSSATLASRAPTPCWLPPARRPTRRRHPPQQRQSPTKDTAADSVPPAGRQRRPGPQARRARRAGDGGGQPGEAPGGVQVDDRHGRRVGIRGQASWLSRSLRTGGWCRVRRADGSCCRSRGAEEPGFGMPCDRITHQSPQAVLREIGCR
jgi:hypothetical protein